MAAYVKIFAQFSSSAGWIFISGNLQLLRIEFEHPALDSPFRLKSSFLKGENPPPASLFIHDTISISGFECFCCCACRISLMKFKQ
ncbi:unnamed protein product [Hymenolepis diminuta]|uniref:Uncharacterized protein n=1 Tax=Hymenolepis diminuta TaxID=6216 RepID=A0A564Y6H6_HYMDI|nr:unnamed protein product [Hymenolepis diminuta]